MTPEKEYAPTTAAVGPAKVTMMSPVPVGFTRYQNSASLLLKEETTRVSWTPPNVIDNTLLLFALTPTTRRRLLPVPTLKLDRVVWNGGTDISPDVDCVPLKTIPVALVVDTVDEAVLVVVVEVVVVDVVPTQCTL